MTVMGLFAHVAIFPGETEYVSGVESQEGFDIWSCRELFLLTDTHTASYYDPHKQSSCTFVLCVQLASRPKSQFKMSHQTFENVLQQEKR